MTEKKRAGSTTPPHNSHGLLTLKLPHVQTLTKVWPNVTYCLILLLLSFIWGGDRAGSWEKFFLSTGQGIPPMLVTISVYNNNNTFDVRAFLERWQFSGMEQISSHTKNEPKGGLCIPSPPHHATVPRNDLLGNHWWPLRLTTMRGLSLLPDWAHLLSQRGSKC